MGRRYRHTARRIVRASIGTFAMTMACLTVALVSATAFAQEGEPRDVLLADAAGELFLAVAEDGSLSMGEEGSALQLADGAVTVAGTSYDVTEEDADGTVAIGSDGTGWLSYDGTGAVTVSSEASRFLVVDAGAETADAEAAEAAVPVRPAPTKAPGAVLAAAPSAQASVPTVETVSPGSTVINMFDYWVTTRGAADTGQTGSSYVTRGINSGHALKFQYSGNSASTIGAANMWTGSNGSIYAGIVADTLGADSMPRLSGASTLTGTLSTSCDRTESLGYLFDPTVENAYRAEFLDVQGLLQLDADGSYYYDSTQNYAHLNESAASGRSRFDVYSSPAVSAGEFFPYNTYATAASAPSAESSSLNHWFGMSITARFLQPAGGIASSGSAMVFNFAGDDDVWIFIDGVLVADIGGIHNKCTAEIDFSTGDVYVNGALQNTLKGAFEDAGRAGATTWSGETFADGTTHTLRFFYLERGGADSNLLLRYNLVDVPATAVYKVDQYGDALPGAVFAAYACDADYNLVDSSGNALPEGEAGYDLDETSAAYGALTQGGVTVGALYVGVTDEGGQMTFTDPYDSPYSLAELKELLGERFVLREISVPDGYRSVSTDIHLRFDGNLLVSEDPYETGVWSEPTCVVTATSTLHTSAGDTIPYYDPSTGEAVGALFAVVVKRNGADAGAASVDQLNPEAWTPVWGDSDTGYSTVPVAGSWVKAAISAARSQSALSDVTFSHTSAGMQAFLEDMPGDPQRYLTHMVNTGAAMGDDDPQYAVAYLWTSASSLDGATASNTVRVVSHGDDLSSVGASSFIIQWGSKVRVPNVENRLIVQTHAYAGPLAEGATDGAEGSEAVSGVSVALYKAVERDGLSCYVGTHGETIRLTQDDGSLEAGGTAVRASDGARGTWEAEAATGTIACIFEDGTTSTIKPATNAAGDLCVAVTMAASDPSNPVGEDGTCVFPKLAAGAYLVRQLTAAPNCPVVAADAQVLVGGGEVAASAGTLTDAVTVGNGAGYLVKTLSQNASEGSVDETLTWVKSLLKAYGDLPFSAFQATAGEDAAWASGAPVATGATQSPSSALVTYLTYDPDSDSSLFDYKATADQSARDGTGAGAGTMRVWTAFGWTRLAVYQDTAHGLASTSENTKYDELATDISTLFSNSTFVRLHSAPSVSLSLVKGAEGADKATLELDKALPASPADVSADVLCAGEGPICDDGDDDPSTVAVAWTMTNDGIAPITDIVLTDEATGAASRVCGTAELLDGDGDVLRQAAVAESGLVTESDGSALALQAGQSLRGWVRVALTASDPHHADTLTVTATGAGTALEASDPFELAASAPNALLTLTVTKVEASDPGTTLPGASFELWLTAHDTIEGLSYSEAPAVFKTIGEAVTDEDGTCSFSGLEPGVYYIAETEAPGGWCREVSGWYVEVRRDGTALTAHYDCEKGGAATGDRVPVTLANVEAGTLPLTGYGPWLLIAAAAAALAAGAALRRLKCARAA